MADETLNSHDHDSNLMKTSIVHGAVAVLNNQSGEVSQSYQEGRGNDTSLTVKNNSSDYIDTINGSKMLEEIKNSQRQTKRT